MRRARPDWLIEPRPPNPTFGRRSIVHEAASLVLGSTLIFTVGLIGYHTGREAERAMLFMQGACRLPPTPTEAHAIAWHPEKGHDQAGRL